MANIYEQTGRYQEALSEYRRRAELSPHRFWDLSMLAKTYAFSGDRARARELLAQALQQNTSEGDLHAQILASVYIALGDKDEALNQLERAYKNRDWAQLQLKVTPYWDPLRSDPRFQDLVRRVGLPP